MPIRVHSRESKLVRQSLHEANRLNQKKLTIFGKFLPIFVNYTNATPIQFVKKYRYDFRKIEIVCPLYYILLMKTKESV